jgi:hypothetical protein
MEILYWAGAALPPSCLRNETALKAGNFNLIACSAVEDKTPCQGKTYESG